MQEGAWTNIRPWEQWPRGQLTKEECVVGEGRSGIDEAIGENNE